MTERGPARGIDTTTPNVARIYDYLLGEKDNFAADRAAAQRLIAATPDMAGIVRDNRAFIGRVVPDEDEPHRLIAEYRDHLAPGSYLAISHGASATTAEDPGDVVGSVTSVYRQASAQLHVRSLAQIQCFFDGFELIDPGVVWMTEWRPDPGVPPAGQPRSLRAGVGRKPG